MTTSILWLRNDLRLKDNPALHAAIAGGCNIVPVYILDDETAGDAKMGGASRWWLHHSLTSLAASLAERGAPLILRRGDARAIIPALAAQTGATAIHAARAFEPAQRAVDKSLHDTLSAQGIAFHRHLSISLFPPERIKNKTGGVYGVYTPFSRACFEAGISEEFFPAPQTIPGIANIESDHLADWALLPTKPNWAGGLKAAWQPGEAGAETLLAAFLSGPIATYDESRNIPGIPGTSKLSPHVHFGEISPRAVFHRAAAATGKGVQTFLKELLWREFAIYLLWHHPNLASKPIRENFADFPWVDDPKGLKAWQQGQTGVPIVDAGMRELWQTGWMHNRVRMITASFLVKHLLIAWQTGEAWFWDTLAEADLAANAASWQWVAGCGADAAPYFRIFNPVLQGLKFDADGAYVRRYVPEIAGLPDKFIHCPWDAPESVLTNAGVTLGKTYPRPIIELSHGRDRALAAFKQISGSDQNVSD